MAITALEAIIRDINSLIRRLELPHVAAEVIAPRLGAAIMKRVVNGFEVDWASERVFAEQQTAPNYGYLFERLIARSRGPESTEISVPAAAPMPSIDG